MDSLIEYLGRESNRYVAVSETTEAPSIWLAVSQRVFVRLDAMISGAGCEVFNIWQKRVRGVYEIHRVVASMQ